MTKKKDTKQPKYACSDTFGYLEVMLWSKPKLNESREVQSKARSSYKDEYCRVSSRYTEKLQGWTINGQEHWSVGLLEKAKFTSIERYMVKVLGFTTEYWTQVKFKKSVYPNKTGSLSSEFNYKNKKNRNSDWKLMRIASATEEFPKKSN